MTREEKIQNIFSANQKVIDRAVERGEMTPEKFALLMESQYAAIKAVNDEK